MRDLSSIHGLRKFPPICALYLPTPSFPLNHDPGGENDSFGLQGSGSPLKQADFSRGFSAALRSRLPLRKHYRCPRENSFPPGFLIHRSPRRAIPARKNWGWARCPLPLTVNFAFPIFNLPQSDFISTDISLTNKGIKRF
jgi:hypothetical protein